MLVPSSGEREVSIADVPAVRGPGKVTLKGTLVIPEGCKVNPN